jgi:acyl-[acyl-carrier-protein] desaturase
MVRLYLERYGESVVGSIREVIHGFRIPLADTTHGYWRWALKEDSVAA